jgi:chromate transporter
MNPLLYFWLFLKGSLFSIGGQGSLPFLHEDLIGLGWAQPEDFLTAIAIGNLSPGPNGLWSVSLGYLTLGWLGAGLALIALTLPPLFILLVSAFHSRFEDHPAVQHFTRGLALGVVGLTFAVALTLANTSISNWKGIPILLAALCMVLYRVPIILILVLAAASGYLIYGI